MPKFVLVVVTVVPFAVMVEVTTFVAVVFAEQPDHVVHGAFVAQLPWVQPLQVLAGQASVPHQLVHGPFVHAPLLAHGPQPWPGRPCPNGPQPAPAVPAWCTAWSAGTPWAGRGPIGHRSPAAGPCAA